MRSGCRAVAADGREDEIDVDRLRANLDASGGFVLPDGVGGIQIANDGGPLHQSVVHNGTTIVFAPNVPPTALDLSNQSIFENNTIGTVVGNFSTTDADIPNDSFRYTLVNGAGPNDNALFSNLLAGSVDMFLDSTLGPDLELQVTDVAPKANVVPEAGVQLTATLPSTMSTADTVNVTAAPAAPVASVLMLTGTVTSGGVASLTMTVKD